VAAEPALRAFTFFRLKYRRAWRSGLVSSVLAPVLFLAAMGLGLGTLVHGRAAGSALAGRSYLAFIAPGLLAANAMQVATGESLWPVLGAIKWDHSYPAMLATPLRVVDVLRGHLLWMALRIAVASGLFLAVVAAFGVAASPAAPLALPAALLTGLAFATPLAAYSATRDGDVGFIALYRFAVVPLFLFSGTFFPVRQLPGPLQPVAYATPLWHGVSLCRALVLGGAAGWASAWHVGYLAVWCVAGYAAARVCYRRRLAR
jgi:lipooligosaccharide transport system permease protein